MRCQTKRLSVHAYVDEDLYVSFDDYRRSIGLATSAGLLSLLVLRELKRRTLRPSDRRGRVPFAKRPKKITTNIDEESALEFTAHTKAIGLSLSNCAAALVERELEEKWLAASLSMDA